MIGAYLTKMLLSQFNEDIAQVLVIQKRTPLIFAKNETAIGNVPTETLAEFS
jgi:hypothetical protein